MLHTATRPILCNICKENRRNDTSTTTTSHTTNHHNRSSRLSFTPSSHGTHRRYFTRPHNHRRRFSPEDDGGARLDSDTYKKLYRDIRRRCRGDERRLVESSDGAEIPAGGDLRCRTGENQVVALLLYDLRFDCVREPYGVFYGMEG